jgi:hypothetical protein
VIQLSWVEIGKLPKEDGKHDSMNNIGHRKTSIHSHDAH